MTLTLYVLLIVFNLGLFVFGNIYIPKRLCTLFGIQRARYFIAAFATFTVGGLWLAMSSDRSNIAELYFYRFSLYWLGFIIYLLFFLILYEIVRLVKELKKLQAGIGILALSLAFVFYGSWNADQYEVYKIDIPIKGLTEEVLIFHAPDIHLGAFRGRETMESVISDIKKADPDFVAINGDLIDGHEALDRELLGLLGTVKPTVYFTGGNHDEYVGLYGLEDMLIQHGVKVLRNEIVHRNGIQLVGLNYMNADEKVFDAHASERTETIKSVLQTMNIDSNIPSVFLHHSPVGLTYMNEAGADLVLAGHTHAGQFFPLNLIAGIQFQYLKGLYKINDTTLYVSQGVGTYGPPLRVGTEGEATLIRLVKAETN